MSKRNQNLAVVLRLNQQAQSATVDVLFTLQATDEPFADGLFLTNIAQGSHGSTNQPDTFANGAIDVTVRSPILTVAKGVLSSDANSPVFSPATVGPVAFALPGLNPGVTPSFTGGVDSTTLTANPVDSNMTGGDSDDLVKFAIVIDNTGGADAFDVLVTDTAPVDFQIPSGPQGLNLEVRDGNGNLLTYTGAAADIFTTGIRINDNGANGAINNFDDAQIAGDGSNIIVITYDLEIGATIDPDRTVTNTASLDEYAANEGGADFTIGNTADWTDVATVTTDEPTVVKDFVDTSIVSAANTNSEVVIGEVVRYQVTVDIPEGQAQNFRIIDNLDQGLEFVDLESVTALSGGVATGDLTSSIGLITDPLNFPPTISGDGATAPQSLTFNFGTLTNANTIDGDAEQLVLVYTTRVLNITGNQATTQLNNSARARWDVDASTHSSNSNSASNVTIIEPSLDVTKSVDVPTGDAGDPIVYTITIGHNPTSTDAFDVTFGDTIPTEIGFVFAADVTVNHSVLGDIKSSFEASGGTIQTIGGSSFDLADGQTVTITVNGVLQQRVEPEEIISNTATAHWTTLDGTDANERTGGGGLNDYTDTSPQANITIDSPNVAKSLVGTSIVTANNANNAAVIGETVQ